MFMNFRLCRAADFPSHSKHFCGCPALKDYEMDPQAREAQ